MNGLLALCGITVTSSSGFYLVIHPERSINVDNIHLFLMRVVWIWTESAEDTTPSPPRAHSTYGFVQRLSTLTLDRLFRGRPSRPKEL